MPILLGRLVKTLTEFPGCLLITIVSVLAGLWLFISLGFSILVIFLLVIGVVSAAILIYLRSLATVYGVEAIVLEASGEYTPEHHETVHHSESWETEEYFAGYKTTEDGEQEAIYEQRAVYYPAYDEDVLVPATSNWSWLVELVDPCDSLMKVMRVHQNSRVFEQNPYPEGTTVPLRKRWFTGSLSFLNDSILGGAAWYLDAAQVGLSSQARPIASPPVPTLRLLSLTHESVHVQVLAWSTDGQRLASGGYNGVRLWNATNGQLLATLSGHIGLVDWLAWSPDGRCLASGGDDNSVCLVDATSGQLLATLSGHTSFVRALAWSSDSHRLASAATDRTIRLWDATSGQTYAVLADFAWRVRNPAKSPNNRSIEEERRMGPEHFTSSLAWSPDGRRLASASWDGAVSSRRKPQSRYDQTVRLWDATNGQLLATLSGHTGPVRSFAWSPDGQRLASVGNDNTIRLWDATNGQLLATFSGHLKWELTFAWSPDGQRLASARGDKTVRLWGAGSGQLLANLSGHTGPVLAVAWSPDGTRLASAGGDKTVRLWDAGSGQLLATLSGHTKWMGTLAWSPDGLMLASVGNDNTIRLWNATNGQPLAVLTDANTGYIASFAWSPDGRRFATAGRYGGIRVCWMG